MKTLLSVGHPVVSLNAVMGYKHGGLVERLQEKMKLSGKDAQVLFDDMKRFLYLCGTQKKSLAPPEIIDEAWHHFILFTEDYGKFCQRFFGRMVHHYPTPKAKRAKRDGTILRRTRKAVLDTFHHELSANWGYKSASCNGCSNCGGSTNCQD